MYPYIINHVKLDQHNINSNETLYYSFTLSVSKFGGSWNTVDESYVRVCVPNKVKK